MKHRGELPESVVKTHSEFDFPLFDKAFNGFGVLTLTSLDAMLKSACEDHLEM